jgi:hypothetical protein
MAQGCFRKIWEILLWAQGCFAHRGALKALKYAGGDPSTALRMTRWGVGRANNQLCHPERAQRTEGSPGSTLR